MGSSNNFNIDNFDKFDEALNIINGLDSCGMTTSIGAFNNNASLSSEYSGITTGISNLKDQISKVANGEGPEKLIQNYKSGYNDIKNAIINAYMAENELVLKNSNIEYSSLAEFFNDLEKTKKNLNGENWSNLQPKNNSDIAHRGHSPGGVYDNSAEAFKIAGESGFWGCEADVRFDKDGNLICSHNAVKNGENPPTLEEYLQICKEYGMTAIIDLKYENGPNKFDENLSKSVLETVEKMGMIDSCVLQTNNPTDVPYIRQNSSDARIWYLTDVISDSNVELIKENGVECVNIKNSSNATNQSRINKLTNNGIDVCVWNVQKESTKERLLDMGATYIMSDNVLGITPYQEGEEDFNQIEL